MVRERIERWVADRDGRVDVVASSAGIVPRPVFSLPSALITINGKKGKKSQKVKSGDSIEIAWDEEVFEGLEAEDIALDVIYEDEDILVISKAQGMVVHPGSGVHSGTLANALLSRYGDDFSTSDDDTRPGIVHRLDKDTSGVMIVARNLDSQHRLAEEFSSHAAIKHYAAIAKGHFKSTHFIIDVPLERDRRNRKKFTTTEKGRGKDAITEVTVVGENGGYALLDIRIYTGRTHQIRVHLSSIGHAVLGDPIYSSRDKNFPDATLMLHSYSLTIKHPATEEEMTFKAALPQRFYQVLSPLGLSEAAAAFK